MTAALPLSAAPPPMAPRWGLCRHYPYAAENTTKVGSISPLIAALVLKVNFIKLLQNASHPFLTLSLSPLYSSTSASSTKKKKRRRRSLIQITS